MTTTPASLSICLTDHAVFLRLPERATFQGSVDFKRLITELAGKKHFYYVLDLERCTLMDSTFLGMLFGLAVKNPPCQAPVKFDLFRPSQRILDQLDNLGLVEHFGQVQSLDLTGQNFTEVKPKAAPDKLEAARISLKAHQDLMEASPANVPRFKDVVAFMAEDLKQLTEKKNKGGAAT
jgi:anti-anti-sigma regulatory factor